MSPHRFRQLTGHAGWHDDPDRERNAKEVTHSADRLTPRGAYPQSAFDVTPKKYVTAIITERGIARPPYTESLRSLVDRFGD